MAAASGVTLVIGSLCLNCAAVAVQDDVRSSGPWDMPRLKEVPDATWGPMGTNGVRQVYYESVTFHDHPTRVFAYCAYPTNSVEPHPALLLVHGKGMHANLEWALHWAARGYVAMAMDLAGEDANGPMADGGPPLTLDSIFNGFSDAQIGDAWMYQAVAAVVRGLSLLIVQPEVNAAQVGVHGLSFGGVISCIVAGIDDRVALAVPVFGAGFLYEDSIWTLPRFAQMDCEQRARWINNFDPSRYLSEVSCPMLFVSGATDVYFWPKGLQRSAQCVPGVATISMRPRLNHGLIWEMPWSEIEVTRFIAANFQAGVPLPAIAPMQRSGNQVSSVFSSRLAVLECRLWYTTDLGPWQSRQWQSQLAEIHDGVVRASLPALQPLSYFLALTDEWKAYVSTPIVEAGSENLPAVLRFLEISSRPGVLDIRGNKPWGHSVTLESSTNNCAWFSVATNITAGDGFTFLVTNSPSSTLTVYRARDLDW